ncbi:hypothetical protein Rmf_31190 [Roseomonas fluvialis]|uniref:Excalibur calcium-binding domain-containing protein n=1 Tax=Roseomonas fluvialis TaxID=1750527 RepID=A0ABN6P768_9PROT|nr:hypothetical protein Rmf_31190 [Roseomonas fluvialis]
MPYLVVLAVSAVGLAVGAILPALRHPIYPLGLAVRHQVAGWHCAAARLVGLAPSYRGGPGYWPARDADLDGIACEAWPRR